jgi:DNA-binding MarR family transcriptional regulator
MAKAEKRKQTMQPTPTKAVKSKTQFLAASQLSKQQLSTIFFGNIGRLMLKGVDIFEHMLLTKFAEHGYRDIRMSHLAVLRNATGAPRLQDIAQHANMTKQAVSQLINQLEDMGYITRQPDPADGRAKLIQFSGRGLKLYEFLPIALKETEQEVIAIMGSTESDVVRTAFEKLIASSPNLG